MISSIFGKTKPINYILILSFLFVFYWFTVFILYSIPYNSTTIFTQIGVLGVLLFMVFIINFIVKRNKITSDHSYTILFFTLLILVFPEILLDNYSIVCSFFLLLALRRLLSIKSLQSIKIKIFDASMWIAVASLFYDWAILFLILVYITIYLYNPKNIRNWIVPLIGVATVFLISSAILILAQQPDYILNHYKFTVSTTSEYLLEWRHSIRLITYVFAVLVLIVITFIKLSNSGQGRINTIRLINIFFLIGITITLLNSNHEISPILMTFFPASVFMSNYIETIKKPNIKEMALIASIIIPFIILMIRFI
ncbi:hypothetical protein I2486_07995 [Cellulophaga sp. E16_2]|uniref:DUF6427 family protein n=1 Tax=Cellulophaga sp. E16_2 TaxID=2789297 RepID=UPI001A923F95|nr:DUF6427 family protein [Cellulophaga sp. E16_2]MBO0591348.1 hypothetical protein [Cellulophaga sp. E16_2]